MATASGTASITVGVVTQPSTSEDFTITGCQLGVGCTELLLDDDDEPTLPASRRYDDLRAGTYTLTFGERAGWSLSSIDCGGEQVDLGAGQATIALAAGEQATCTFRPVAEAPSLTIAVQTEPMSGQDVPITGCEQGSGCAQLLFDDDADPTLPSSMTAANLRPGTYTLTQGEVPGYSLVDLACDTGEQIALGERRAAIDLIPGEHTTCTFTNAAPAPSITIVQDTRPDPGADAPPEWGPAFTVRGCESGAGCADHTLVDPANRFWPEQRTFGGLRTGTYTLTQLLPAERNTTAGQNLGWALTDLHCNSGEEIDLGERRATIDLGPFEHVTCTFTDEPIDHDDLADAVTLPDRSNARKYYGSTVGATTEPGERNSGLGSVWYRVSLSDPAGNPLEYLRVDTCDSAIDTILEVYRGTAASTDPAQLVLEDTSTSTPASCDPLAIEAEAGVYYVAVRGAGPSETGAFNLTTRTQRFVPF